MRRSFSPACVRRARPSAGASSSSSRPTPCTASRRTRSTREAVARLLEAKGRGRQSPPPVLVAGLTTLRALVAEVPEPVERLVEQFWPGGLTDRAAVAAVADVGSRRDPRHRRGADAGAPDRPRAPRGDRPARRLEREPHRQGAGDRGGRRAGDAGRQRRGVPRRRARPPPASRRRSSTRRASSAAPSPLVRVLRDGAVDRVRLREVLGDLLEPDPQEPDAP